MKVCSASLRRMVASSLILAFTIIPIPSAMAQGTSKTIADVEGFDLPESPMEKAQRERTTLSLSITEAIKLALENNISIEIQNLQEENTRLSLRNAYAAYDPTLSISALSFSRTVGQTTDYLGNLVDNTSDTQNLSGATVRKRFMWGGNASAGLTGLSRRDASCSNTSYSSVCSYPTYSSNISLSYQQPLLRNLRIDSQRNQIRIANLNIETNEIQFKNQVTSIIAQVQQQYWALVLAMRQYEIQRNSVKLSQMNLRDNRKRLEVGTIPPINVIQAEANLARTEVSLFSSENSILQAQNNLRQTISNDRTSEIWKKFIVPTDLPDFVEYKIDLETAIAKALQNRSEIETAKLNLKQNEWSQQLNRENKKWGLDVNVSYTRSGNAVPADANPPLPILGTDQFYTRYPVGGLPSAIKSIFSEPGYTFQVSFNITVPVWQRSTDISIAQNEIQRRNQLTQLRQTEQNIMVEVTNAIQSLESNRLSLTTAAKSRELSQMQYETEQKRYDVGMTQNNILLDALNAVASAELSELQALVNYKQAVVTLQRAMNTLLESSDFAIAKGRSLDIPKFK